MTVESDLSLLLARTSTILGRQNNWIDGQAKLLTGSATDPASFDANGLKVGPLGYYPVSDIGGVTVYLPCLERQQILLNASRSMLIANGSAPAALATTVATAADVQMVRSATVTLTSTTQRLTQAVGGTLDLNGGKIVYDYTDASNSTNFEARTVLNGTIELAATRNIGRLMRFSNAMGRMRNVTVRAVNFTVNSDDGNDSLIRVAGDDFVAENVTLENLYIGFTVAGKNAKFKNVTCRGMIKGIAGNGGSATIRELTWYGTDASAATEPGQGAITGNWSRLDVEGFYIGPSEDLTTRPRGTGEHAIYIGGLGKALESDIRIVNGRIRRPGQCGLKFKDLAKVHASKVDTSWTSYGSAAGDNEEGYRFQRCGLVTGGELNVTKEMVDGVLDGGYAGYTHMFFSGCDNVVLLAESYAEGSHAGGVKFGIDDDDETIAHGNHTIRVRHKLVGGPSLIIADNAVINGEILVYLNTDGCPASPVQIGSNVTWGTNGNVVLVGTYRRCGAPPPASTARIDLSRFTAF